MKKNTELQQELDIKKWLESEQAKKDLCSTYDYCTKCDKNKNEPCALAYKAFNKKPSKPVLSFAEKLAIAKDETKEKFCNLCNDVKSNDITLRVCKKNVTLRSNKVLIGLITLTRNSLKIHLALDPTLHEEVLHIDYSDKKTYADTPFTIKLNTKKSIKASISLLNEIKNSI